MSIIKFALLKIPVAIDRIRGEVNALQGNSWQPHMNTYDYDGEWTVLSLRSPGGKDNPLAEAMNNEDFADTVLMKQCPAIYELVSQLQCEINSVRLLNLKAGGIIKEHRDRELSFENGEVRLHFPVFTNPQVDFFLDNIRLEMHEGDCWYINANLPHRLANKSNKDRIHLVVDCGVNDWLKSIFRDNIIHKDELSDDEITLREKTTILRTIAELRRQTENTIALDLADKLEKKLSITDARIDHPRIADTIISFIRSIGIVLHEEPIEKNTFLPGILIREGELVIDRNKMTYPGDLLHEAGHIAVALKDSRKNMNGNLENNESGGALEMMTIAWSYAACVYLNLDPHIVFHEDGYKGDGASIVENFQQGRFFGTPMLQWCGMTIEPKNNKGDNNVFPKMIKWMRE